MKGNLKYGDKADGVLVRQGSPKSAIRMRGRYRADCFDKYTGGLKWSATAHNEVFAAGLQHVIDVVFGGDTKTTEWFIALTDSSPTFSSDDVSSAHAGWSEVTAYTGDRKEWDAGRTNQTIDNSSNKATFTLDADGTNVGGAALWGDSDGDTAPSLVFSGAAFSGGDKSGDSGDKIVVTYTLVASDDTSS